MVPSVISTVALLSVSVVWSSVTSFVVSSEDPSVVSSVEVSPIELPSVVSVISDAWTVVPGNGEQT